MKHRATSRCNWARSRCICESMFSRAVAAARNGRLTLCRSSLCSSGSPTFQMRVQQSWTAEGLLMCRSESRVFSKAPKNVMCLDTLGRVILKRLSPSSFSATKTVVISTRPCVCRDLASLARSSICLAIAKQPFSAATQAKSATSSRFTFRTPPDGSGSTSSQRASMSFPTPAASEMSADFKYWIAALASVSASPAPWPFAFPFPVCARCTFMLKIVSARSRPPSPPSSWASPSTFRASSVFPLSAKHSE